MSSEAQWTLLVAHPDTPGEFVWRIAAEIRLEAASLLCGYTLYGDMAHVRVPGVQAGRRADGLWEHTCFEAFVAPGGLPGYYEFNFSPSLEWAAYRFEDYRCAMAPAGLARAPGLHVRRTAGQLEVTATVHLEGLADLARARALRLGIAAIVEDDGGTLSYWALKHAPGNPDFHHPDAFAIELDAACGSGSTG